MALALGMPRGFFVAGRPAVSTDSGKAHFRSLRSTSLRDRRRALTHAAFAWELTTLLEEYVRIPPVSFPQAVLPERASTNDLERLADDCRRVLDIGPGPISNLTRLLESCGAVVVRLPVQCRKVDAFSCVLKDQPIVVLNADKVDKARLDTLPRMNLGTSWVTMMLILEARRLNGKQMYFAAAFSCQRTKSVRSFRLRWTGINLSNSACTGEYRLRRCWFELGRCRSSQNTLIGVHLRS